MKQLLKLLCDGHAALYGLYGVAASLTLQKQLQRQKIQKDVAIETTPPYSACLPPFLSSPISQGEGTALKRSPCLLSIIWHGWGGGGGLSTFLNFLPRDGGGRAPWATGLQGFSKSSLTALRLFVKGHIHSNCLDGTIWCGDVPFHYVNHGIVGIRSIVELWELCQALNCGNYVNHGIVGIMSIMELWELCLQW